MDPVLFWFIVFCLAYAVWYWTIDHVVEFYANSWRDIKMYWRKMNLLERVALILCTLIFIVGWVILFIVTLGVVLLMIRDVIKWVKEG